MDLVQEVISDFITMLQERLSPDFEIKAFVASERSLDAVQEYPTVFVLCPDFVVTKWFEDGYIDVDYSIVIGVIDLSQDTEALRTRLYYIVSEFITTCMQAETDGFNYTFNQVNPFRANFSPIFTNGAESFIADGQVALTARRKRVG